MLRPGRAAAVARPHAQQHVLQARVVADEVDAALFPRACDAAVYGGTDVGGQHRLPRLHLEKTLKFTNGPLSGSPFSYVHRILLWIKGCCSLTSVTKGWVFRLRSHWAMDDTVDRSS